MNYAARLRQEVLVDLLKPTGQAKGLPGWAYSEPAFFEFERQTYFRKIWVGIAYESDVPESGSAVPVTYAGWDFILTRADDGKIRCFFNICKHRGMKVLRESRTACRTIVCPWHAWSYDLQGRLRGTPNIGGVRVHESPNLDRDALGLVEVRCDTWLGVIFVNVDGEAPSLADFVRPMAERLGAFDFSVTRESELAVELHYDANWKFVIEGAVEDYHIPFVHSQIGPQGHFEAVLGDSYIGVASRRDLALAQRRIPDRADLKIDRSLPYFPHMPDNGEFEASLILTLVPSTVVSGQLNHAVVTLYIPETVNRTRVRRRFRFVGESAVDPGYAAARQQVRDSWNLVSEQDGWVHYEVQRLAPLRQDAGFRPVFSEFWEGAVHQFQKIVATNVAGVPMA